MTEEKTEKPRGSGVALKSLLASAGTGLIIFFCHTVWDSIGTNEKTILELNARIRDLENDKAKWELLSDISHRVVLIEKGESVQETHIEWLRWAVGHNVSVKDAPRSQQPTVPPPPNFSTTPPPKGADRPDDQQQKIPADELKRMYEQRVQQKK